MTQADELTPTTPTSHTATVALRVVFEFDNEFDYARKLMEVLGAANVVGEAELMSVDREAGNVRSERRGRDRIGMPRRARNASAPARMAADADGAGSADQA